MVTSPLYAVFRWLHRRLHSDYTWLRWRGEIMNKIQDIKKMAYNSVKQAHNGNAMKAIWNFIKDVEFLIKAIDQTQQEEFTNFAYNIWLFYDEYLTTENPECKRKVEQAEKRIAKVVSQCQEN